jgi:hypothetical protein
LSTSLATGSPAIAAVPSRRRPLVAVLPFTPRGEDPGLRLLGNDIADCCASGSGRMPRCRRS